MTLKEKYAPFFRIGAAVNTRTVDTRAGILKAHFNSLTCENDTKPEGVTRDGVSYDFTRGDKIVNFAREHGMAFRLHTLAWHQATPEAMYGGRTREAAITMMESHFSKMAAKYGDAYAVDVVNEALDDSEGKFLRDTPLKAIIGDDYVDVAYTLARKYFPGNALVYNDYLECDPVKSKKIFELIHGMKRRGVPVDVFGFQSHYNIYSPEPDAVRRAFELYSKLGVRFQVTELDASLFAYGDASSLPAPAQELLQRQAGYYRGLFAVYREYAELIDSVTFWGVADPDSWLNNFPVKGRHDWPLPFDGDGNAKSCVESILDF